MTDRGLADLLADLHHNLLEHEARLESLLKQVLERERLREPSVSTVHSAPAAGNLGRMPAVGRPFNRFLLHGGAGARHRCGADNSRGRRR
jgi:hypothetical protein